jgi:transposase
MRETAALARDLWQLELSVGAVADACQKASLALASSYTEAHTHLKAHSSEVNVDETGWRDSGKRGWLWVAVSKVATVFKLGSKRNRASFQELIPKDYLGVVGSDRYSAYYALDPARHQLCLAHILRNLKGLEVRAEPTAKWATTTRELVTSLFHSWHTFKINPTPDAAQKRATLLAEVEPIRIAITEQLELGLTLQPEDKKLTRFCRQLKKHEARLWVFVNVQGIEPTNNAAERALRPAVIWRKTSFGTQGENGQRFVERMLTIRATCRLSGHNFLEFLSASLKAHWSSQPMPSLFATP